MKSLRLSLLVSFLFLEAFLEGSHFAHAFSPPLDFVDGFPEIPIRSQRAPETPPVAEVPGLGTALGRTLKSYEGRTFYGFLSIPYAMPPAGDQRFKYPVPWSGTWPEETENGEYDATYLRARCPQPSMILDITSGREDCLHVSIYTPMIPNVANKLPVMVWIHGGAYTTGDASLYVPTKLMDRDVIVVVVQYRLGVFGFLAGGIPEAPGNMGLMDQITALRWVQNYIEHFGGNTDLVTVFGQSAGGASSSWMQVTPLTGSEANGGRQLFHRVIPQSGSVLERWTIDPVPPEGFQLTAEILGCWEAGNSAAVVECMRGKTVDEINEAGNTLFATDASTGGLGFKGLCPVVQNTPELVTSELEIVIPDKPRDMLQNGTFLRVPMMAGTVRDEGSLVVGLAYEAYMVPNGFTVNNTEFMKYESIATFLKAFGLDDQTGALENTMRVAYLPNAELGDWNSMVGGIVDMTGVMFLKSGLWDVASFVNRAAPELPIYFYSWEFESDDSLFYWMFSGATDLPVPGGISHADELPYLFHLPAFQDARERNMTRRMVTLWTNFAKYGDPTPDNVEHPSENWHGDVNKWEAYDNNDYKFMLMQNNFVMHSDFTTRWHHHRDINASVALAKDSSSAVKGRFNEHSDPNSVVSRKDYEEALDDSENFKIATGVLGGLIGLAVVGAAVFAVFQILVRKKKQQDDMTQVFHLNENVRDEKEKNGDFYY